MTPPIERIRFYDGEYLRAFDFAAEQGYHVDMRRRLNMALHLSGIGVGLQLKPSASSAVVSQVYITPGMGIDEFGREVYLPAPYTFDDQADLAVNRLPLSGSYYCYVWIKYQRLAETPPSAGYATCNGSAQTTRWRESYQVVLKQTTAYTKSPTAASAPAVTDDISEDDPDPDNSNGVFLGVVKVDPTSLTGVFSIDPKQPQPPLRYVGLCAQQIHPPNFTPPPTPAPAFDPTSTANSLLTPIGVDIPANLFVDQNLVVGANFSITNPNPPAATSGNVKITGDLYLNGNLYTNNNGKGQTIQDLITNSLPDIQLIQPRKISVDTTGASLTSGQVDFPATVSSTLQKVKDIAVLAVLCGIEWQDAATLKSWFQSPDAGSDSAIVAVSAVKPTLAPQPATYTISIQWQATWSATIGGKEKLGIRSIQVGLVVIFSP
jgi:hypothetical protein